MYLLEGRRCRALYASLLAGVAALSATPQAMAQSPTRAPAVEDGGLDEIIVTAQRREENLQDVPISVTAISGDALISKGLGSSTDLGQIVPSVQITRSGVSAIFFVRGVGNTSGSVGEEGANAIYVDGVYLGDLSSAATEFNNIERIEVLKGPQGTLFGRNSSGGLIHVITREPGDEPKLSARAGFGSYDTFSGQLYASTPLNDKLGIDIALTGKKQDEGFGTNLATGKDVQLGWSYGARSKLVFRPGDATKIVLSGDFYKAANDYQMGFNLFKGTVGIGGYRYPGDYNLNTTDPAFLQVKSWGTSLTVEHEFDAATLTSITSRRAIKVDSAFDADYTPIRAARARVPSEVTSFQQELRLTSASTTPLSWQVGLFYYRAIADVQGFALRGVGGVDSGYDINARMKTDSYAGFGEVNYDITDSTHLTAGLRYTQDKRTYVGEQFGVNQVPGTPLANAFNITGRQKLSTGRFTYRLALRQDLNDRLNVYASYNRGFKSGIFATTGSPNDPPVKPQTIDAYEVGLKSELFDRMLRFNIAAFHYDISDYQVRASPAPGRTLLLNAASVKVDGIEAEVNISPLRGLQLGAVVSYLDSRFSSFPGALFSYQSPAVCNAVGTRQPGATTGPATGGGITCVGNATGKRTPLSPVLATSLTASYRMPVGDDSEVILNGLWNRTGKTFFEADNRLSQKAYNVVNASIEYRPVPAVGFEIWANNLTDARYYLSGVGGTTGDHGELAAPRTYGLNFKLEL